MISQHGSDDDFEPLSNKPLPELVLTKIFDAMKGH